MTKCPRCGGHLGTSRAPGELAACVTCGHRVYDGPIITPTAGELRTQKYTGIRRKRYLCGCGKLYERPGKFGPPPARCPLCRERVRMSGKAHVLRRWRARTRVRLRLEQSVSALQVRVKCATMEQPDPRPTWWIDNPLSFQELPVVESP